jgi:hypothetical protein
MDRYSEDEIRILKQMSEEVFVISNKPQLPFVQKMKQTACDIMSTGFKKVAGDFFYCKACDKEHKFPICKKCFDKCHKGHLKSDNIKPIEIIPSYCMCGYKCHSMLNKKKEEDIDLEQNTSKCYFNNLSLAAGQYEYFIAINGRKICSFCYHFCCHNLTTSEDDEESKMKAFQKYQFRKMKVSREVFIKGIEDGQITCDCLSLIDSKHRFSDNLYIYLNDLNIPFYSEYEDDNYFSNSSPTKIINLFFNCVELFETIYTNFILEYNEFMESLSNKNDLLSINAALNLGYANFSNNANNCSYNLYINEKINVYFTVTLTKCLLEKNLKINEQNNIFLINYLRGFIKFRLGSYIEQIPKYLITDIFNLNPFQRRIWREKCCTLFIQSGLKKENLIKTILSSIERIIRQKPDLGESIQIFIELFRVLKYYSRFFFLNKEEITEICKIVEEFFSYITEFYSTEETIEILYKDERAKLFKTIIKIITYFSVYINDETFFSFFGLRHPLEQEDDQEKAFFHCFTEASKLINKILILLCNGIRQEYDIVTYLINKNKQKLNENKIINNKSNHNPIIQKKSTVEGQDEVYQDKASNDKSEEDLSPMTNEEYQIILMRTLHIVQINLDFSLQNQDVYIQGLLRIINKNLPLYFNIINDTYSENEEEQTSFLNFTKVILEFTEHLEDLYYNFYNASHITIDFIQDYIISVTNDILLKFNKNYDNLLYKQGNIYYCEYANIIKDDVANKNSKISYEFLINKSSNFLYSLTKVFKLSKDKSVFSEELCRNIIKICFAFINDNPDNAIIGLSTPILINLSKLPRPYLCCVLDYMTLCLKVLQKNNANITFGFFMAKFGFLIHHKTTENSKANKGKALPNTYLCLVRLFSLLELIFTFDIYDQNQYLDFIRPNLQIFIEDELIYTYKRYLLRIAEDFAKYRKYYTSKRIFDQPELFEKYFKKFISVTNNFNSSLIFQIFFMFLKLTNKAFDVNALEKTPDFLSDFFSQRDILTILSIITLDIPLRVELIKYFRMIYIDLSIEMTKMEEYRYQFHQEIDVDMERVDTLMNVKSMKVFLFLQRLLKVSDYSFNSELSQLEYQLIFFEAKNFKKIVMNAKHCDKKVYMSYIENGLILPIKVYLNKISSMMMTIRGEGLLQLYRFCYYVLKMKEFIIESNIISNIPEEDKLQSVFKDQDFVGEGGLSDVKKDIEHITNPNFSVLNYREIYVLINKHVMSLIEEPTSSELVLYLSEYKKFEEKEKEVLKNHLKKNGIDLEKPLYKNAWEAYECYMEQKNNFDKSSLKANFDDTLINGEVTLRTIALKYLLFLAKNKANIFEEEGVNMLLKLLKNEPDESQASILLKSDKDENKNINIKRLKGKENAANPKQTEENPVVSVRESQVEDINYMAKSCFENILSSIFNQYNPTSLKLSNQYYHACHIIKVFKYLCEANNQYFQKRLMNDITFSISQTSKLNFYDMMLFVIDKIIVISSWEQAKGEDIVQDYFYGLFSCIIELIIEIIRGTDTSIFRNFFNNEDNEENNGANNINNINNSDDILSNNNAGINIISNKNVYNGPNNIGDVHKSEKSKTVRKTVRRRTRKMVAQRYQRGKALKIFLNNIKTIMLESTSENEIIFSVRKSLMDFLLSFMEEVNCPKKIKHLIMSFYHPNVIIKSICSTLKLYYLKKFKIKDTQKDDPVKQVRTNQIIEQNLSQGNLGNKPQNEKPLYKLLKQLKFNEDLCNKFLDLYFEDIEFSETKTFELCNVYFRYFILSYIQFKNEETIDYWNRIHGQTQETLNEYNRRTKINNNLDSNYRTVNDESDFEAYYVIKLFKEIIKYILVKVKPDIPPIYVVYTVHPYSRYLSSDSKDEFLRNVDRTNRYSKLYDLITASEYFKLEIIYNWNYLRKSQILRKSTEINYHMLGYVTFFISLILNFVLFCTLHHEGKEWYGHNTQQIVDIFSYFIIIVEIIIVIFWFLTKYLLYLEIEMAKYKEKHYRNDKFDDTQLTLKDKFKIKWKTIFGKGELTPFLLYLLFTIPGVINGLRFFYSFSLLSILSLSQTLNNIIKSLGVKGNSLAWTTVFTLVLLYEFAGWGFYYQRDRFYETAGRDKPDQMCESLIYCFLTMINNGMRWHCGVGKITRSESYILHFWPFVHRFAFDLLFFWIIEAMMLKIVYGIILDSFGELRQAHYLIEKDIANNCFICNIEKDECEKNNISFEEHCNQVHNVWDYAFYMITLRMKEASTLNSSNARNRKKIIEKSVDWLPDASLDKLEDNNQKKKENDGDIFTKNKDTAVNNNVDN